MGVPKLTEYLHLLNLLWTIGLSIGGWWYVRRAKRRRREESLQKELAAGVVKQMLQQEKEEKRQILNGILHVSNGNYASLQRKLEIAEAKNVELTVKMLEQQTEIAVLNKLLEIRRSERKVKIASED